MQKTILLVEDNDDDIIFMKRAFKHSEMIDSLRVVKDGQEALDYLMGANQFNDRRAFPSPCLILLDLKLPRRGGLEVLQWIRENPEMHSMVVLVLTTSRERKDLEKAYELGVNAFLVKPPAYQQLAEMVKAIKDFWLGFNEFVPCD
jgi:CheY-like chemotaxis protein